MFGLNIEDVNAPCLMLEVSKFCICVQFNYFVLSVRNLS